MRLLIWYSVVTIFSYYQTLVFTIHLKVSEMNDTYEDTPEVQIAKYLRHLLSHPLNWHDQKRRVLRSCSSLLCPVSVTGHRPEPYTEHRRRRPSDL
jgi:hypothetical protein